MAQSGEGVSGHEQQQKQEEKGLVRWSKYSKRVVLSSILCRGDGGKGLEGQRVVVGGWVRSSKAVGKKGLPALPAALPHVPVVSRDVTCSEVIMIRLPFLRPLAKLFIPVRAGEPGQKPNSGHKGTSPAVTHLKINDGSCICNLQVLIDSSISFNGQITVGASVLVEGVLKHSPEKDVIELIVEKVLHVGLSDPQKYPFAKKLSLESSRLYPHLRSRTTTAASIIRMRNGLSSATNAFFQKNGFVHVHMPIITTAKSTGNSENFQVTTLLEKSNSSKETSRAKDEAENDLNVVRAAIKEKSRRIEELKRSNSNKDALTAALQDLKNTNELAFQLEMHQKSNSGALLKVEKVDFSKDFFSQPAYLSISAGLHLESYACALSSVYTFGPIFQAKIPESKKQLAEMWMIEVELAFSELEDVMNCAEDYLKFMCQWILENFYDDLRFASKRMDKNCIERLQLVASCAFERITYLEAVENLKKVTNKTFETRVDWGTSLTEEHESYLVDEMYKRPVIVYDYPKKLRPFYVHLKDDGRTVSSFDVILPKVGVLIRGSQKEERIDVISSGIDELGLPREQYEWYLELRRHGTVKHSGFSLGFENMVMFATGIDDARDVIPFPRTPGNAPA